MGKKICLFTHQRKWYHLELDLENRSIQKKYSFFGPKKIHGEFYIKGKEQFLYYKDKKRLFFRANEKTVQLDENRTRTDLQADGRNVNFRFFLDDEVWLNHNYKLKDPLESIGYDEFISDFFLQVHSLVNDPGSWEDLFQA